MKKKVLAVVLTAAMVVASLTGCGKTPAGVNTPAASTENKQDTKTPAATEGQSFEYDITVWVPEAAVALTEKQIADFNASNTDGIKLNPTIEAVSEADAATTMLNDVEAGADIFFFAQDQAARLIQAGALAQLGEAAQGIVSAANDAGVVSAAKAGDAMYAYPLTSDNGYFLFYDKSVVDPSHVDSLEAIIADCEAAGKMFSMENETSAWYIAAWFFGTGCHSNWVTDDAGKFISVDDNFNSADGLVAAKGMYKLLSSTCYTSSSSADAFTAAIPAGALVSGNWNTATIKEMLGDNFAVADLPSFEVDGKSYHMGSYNGCKLVGVKPQTDVAKQACVHKLAQFLTNEEAQMERFTELSWGPANLNAQSSDAVKADEALSALLQQNQFSVPQGQIHGSWWDIAKVIGTDVMESDGSDEGLKAALQKYEDTIAALFTMSSEEMNAFTVIGAICGTSWDTDFAMTADGNVWSSEAMDLNEGEEFKVRQGKSWDVNFGDGGDNFKVPATGKYVIKFTFNEADTTGTIELIAQ